MNSASQSMLPDASGGDANAQLDLIGERRAASTRLAAAVWFPLLLGGVANLGCALVLRLAGHDDVIGLYWSIAGPCIAVACGLFYARRPIHMRRHIAPIAWVLAWVLAGTPVLVGFLWGASAEGLPLLIVAAGLAGFAVLYRSGHVAVMAFANLLAAAAIYAQPDADIAVPLFLSLGSVGCVLALLARRSAQPVA